MGVTGCGKTTAAERIAALRKLPFVDFDQDIRWKSASEAVWTCHSEAEQLARCQRLASEDSWVLASCSSAAFQVLRPRIELVVYLDYPMPVSFTRLLRRSISRVTDKKPICNGNVETWAKLLSTDSILIWWFRTIRRRQRQARQLEINPDMPPTLRVTKPQQLEQLICSIAES